MKVFLQYPWRFPDSPYYKYLIENPPKNVEYLNIGNQKGVITDKTKLRKLNSLKRFIRESVRRLKIPIINAHTTKTNEKYDLIHCAHCLSKNNSPWVVDVEVLWQFYLGAEINRISTKRIKKLLMRKNCKKIIAWTEHSKKEIENAFPEVKNKIEVVYPAVPAQKFKKIKDKKIRLFFVGRSFYEKGGLDVLRIFDYLTKKYNNVECTIVSEIPFSERKRYSHNNKIKFLGLMPKEELNKIYAKTDIFVYPGYSDTFGFAILESMSWGIPVVSVKGGSKEELIKNGKTGFVVEPPKKPYIGYNKVKNDYSAQHPHYKDWTGDEIEFTEKPDVIKNIIDKTSILIENRSLLKKMSSNCLNEIKNEKFSIQKRNKNLQKIYKESLEV